MKSLILFSLLFASLAAHSDVNPVYSAMAATVLAVPNVLVLDDASNVNFTKYSNGSGLTVTYQLVGESESAVSSYLSHWGLVIENKGGVFAVSNRSKGGLSISDCNIATLNGRITKLKGVCVNEIDVSLPDGYVGLIQSDGKTILIQNNNAQQSVAPAPQYNLITPTMVQILTDQLKGAHFESDQIVVLRNFTELTLKPAGLSIDGAQIVKIFSAFDFDDGKLDTLKAFKPYIVNLLPNYGAIIDSLTFDPSKKEAQQILLGN